MTHKSSLICLSIMAVVPTLSTGCQTTRRWSTDFRKAATTPDESPQQASAQTGPTRSDSSVSSLESAAAKIDQAAAFPEREEPSFYASRESTTTQSASPTCKSGCCR